MTGSDVPPPAGQPGGAEPDPGTHPIEGVAFAAPETPPAPGSAPPPAAGSAPPPAAASRPAVRVRGRGPVTRMGPWAPVAGALLGTALGLLAVLLLSGTADGFRERLALVLLVVGMGLLGASGPLLADEVRLVRRGVREAAVRPASVEVAAGLLNGLTPARLLLLVSGFVLFLAAYVVRG
ncbi:hypothetical protein [Geodermatophilus sp. SYSU D00815]